MKRKDIVANLLKEGFSDKTLASLSDKQLAVLSERVLGEQYYSNEVNPVHIPKTDMNAINLAKQKKEKFITYEGEVTEDKSEEKFDVIKKIEYKIKHCKDKKKLESYKELLKRMKDGEVNPSGKEIDEEEKPKFKTKTEWLKSAGIIKDDDDDDKKEETKESMGLNLNEWVDQIVGNKVYPFTSKNEILSLIEQKMNEQEAEVAEPEVDTEALPDFLTFDQIKNAEVAPAKPTTKPTTKPGNPDQKPQRPATPYQPGPGINPAPKAEKK